MRTSDFDYDLPPERIAQTPAEPRDAARLMVVERGARRVSHRRFHELDHLLAPGDLLVANDSRVIPARLHGRKTESGGAVEVLLLKRLRSREWQALIRGRVRAGTRLTFDSGDGTEHGPESMSRAPLGAVVKQLEADGVRVVRFDRPLTPLLPSLGAVPLPPYISETLDDPERYQTVYSRVAGSVAAPTAGLHFTPDLLARLAAKGIEVAFVTLHVGLDTFRPVGVDRIADHHMHSEWAVVPAETAAAVTRARDAERRVVAVGTTSVRALEAAAAASDGPALDPFDGWTDLFITPGYGFGAVNAMVTNFHLPRTTLLMLVAALAGKETMDTAYQAAVDGPYRFYSFGDAMLIM